MYNKKKIACDKNKKCLHDGKNIICDYYVECNCSICNRLYESGISKKCIHRELNRVVCRKEEIAIK